MKRKQQQVSYEIIGCDHRFVPTKETYKSCDSCGVKLKSEECMLDINVGERYFVWRKYSY